LGVVEVVVLGLKLLRYTLGPVSGNVYNRGRGGWKDIVEVIL
jgi:hypothetical protein